MLNHRESRRVFTILFSMLLMISCSVFSSPTIREPQLDTKQYLFLRETRTDLPEVIPQHPFSIADMDGDGFPEVVQGLNKTIKFFGRNQQLLSDIPPLACPISQLVIDDIGGDGLPEALIGTSETGAVYAYSYSHDDLVIKRVGQTKHVWASSTAVIPLVLNGDSKKGLLTVAQGGAYSLWKFTSQGFIQLGKGVLDQANPRGFVTVDLDVDGNDEVVVADEKGVLYVYQFQYGTLNSIGGTSLAGNLKWLGIYRTPKSRLSFVLAYTDQGVLNILEWDASQLRIRDQYRLPNEVASCFYSGDINGDGYPEIAVSGSKGKLWVYQFKEEQLLSLGCSIWDEDVIAIYWSSKTDLILVHTSGKLSMSRFVDENYIRILTVKGEYESDACPVLRDGRIYISVKDIEPLFGIRVRWDNTTKQIILSKGANSYTFTIGNSVYYIGNKKASIRLDAPLINIEGRIYMPLKELDKLFRVNVEWSKTMRTLTVR